LEYKLHDFVAQNKQALHYGDAAAISRILFTVLLYLHLIEGIKSFLFIVLLVGSVMVFALKNKKFARSR
jgi:uncharacterized MAPEG superfamily protein